MQHYLAFMATLAQATSYRTLVRETGGIIFPPLAALRQRPPSTDEIVTRSVARTLALCGLDAEPIPRRAKANWRNSTNN